MLKGILLNPLTKVIAERVLGNTFLARPEWKTGSGILSMLLGGGLYLLQKNGIEPATVDGTFRIALDYLQGGLIDGGLLLTIFGLGQKTPKPEAR